MGHNSLLDDDVGIGAIRAYGREEGVNVQTMSIITRKIQRDVWRVKGRMLERRGWDEKFWR